MARVAQIGEKVIVQKDERTGLPFFVSEQGEPVEVRRGTLLRFDSVKEGSLMFLVYEGWEMDKDSAFLEDTDHNGIRWLNEEAGNSFTVSSIPPDYTIH